MVGRMIPGKTKVMYVYLESQVLITEIDEIDEWFPPG